MGGTMAALRFIWDQVYVITFFWGTFYGGWLLSQWFIKRREMKTRNANGDIYDAHGAVIGRMERITMSHGRLRDANIIVVGDTDRPATGDEVNRVAQRLGELGEVMGTTERRIYEVENELRFIELSVMTGLRVNPIFPMYQEAKKKTQDWEERWRR